MLFSVWVGREPYFIFEGDQMDGVDRFNYMGSCIAPDGKVFKSPGAFMHTDGSEFPPRMRYHGV